MQRVIVIGVVAVIAVIMIGFAISNFSTEETIKVVVKGDVIVPTKASRPGCDKSDTCYVPSVIVVDSGNSVTWVNEDSAFHSVTSGFYDEPSDLFDSGYLDPNEPFVVDFDKVGTYDYFCTLHPWMKGQVVVE